MSTILEHLLRHVLYHVGREVGGYLSRTPNEPSEEQPPRGETPEQVYRSQVSFEDVRQNHFYLMDR